MEDVRISRLDEFDNDDMVHQLAKIYIEEWGWHYADEWEIHTVDEMAADIMKHYTECTYVATTIANGRFVGTVAILDADLKSHAHVYPWVTCLYVDPNMRGHGIGKRLLDFACSKTTTSYLWCYSHTDCLRYQRWGFELLETVPYKDNCSAHVMVKHI